ncbi:dipeptidase [Pleurocapsa sp. PCC 7319]|uniref:dipeptidase n=1 Tax=Pleurocapsa sp. PCC 7319 TaxID=118161 RepID=UPI000345872D|nr:dipeptidase [Pleurocapsa sp. PCC 7319]
MKDILKIYILLMPMILLALNGCTLSKSLSERTSEIHDQILTVDTHIDWPMRQFLNPDFNPGVRHAPGQRESGQWDLIRMKEGGLDAVFMSIFTPQKKRTDEGHATAKEVALKQIELTKKMVAYNPDLAEIALTPEDAYRLEKTRKRAIFIGMENGYPIAKDLRNLQLFFNLGVRYITITHSKNNQLGDSSTDEQPEWGGLSPFGEKVVQEMNRLGMMVDISHVHDETFWDVIKLTKAPVIASHSSARMFHDVPHNMSDEMLKAIAKNGGVVQVALLDDFIKEMEQTQERATALEELKEETFALLHGELSQAEHKKVMEKMHKIDEKHPKNRPTLADAIDHLDHMVQVMGIDHVGIGSDFDGGGGLVGIDDVSEMPNITRELLARGYTADEIRKLWGGNLMRVFNQVIKVAEEPQKQN